MKEKPLFVNMHSFARPGLGPGNGKANKNGVLSSSCPQASGYVSGVCEVGIEHTTEMASYLPRALHVSSCFIAGASLAYRTV